MLDENGIEIHMNIRDMDAEFELEAMAEPDVNGVLSIRVVECESIEVPAEDIKFDGSAKISNREY